MFSTILHHLGELKDFKNKTLPKDWKLWKTIFPGLPNKYKEDFQFSISTDGIGASILIKDPRIVISPPISSKKSKKKKSSSSSSTFDESVNNVKSLTPFISSTPKKYSEFTTLTKEEEEMMRKFVLKYRDKLLVQSMDPGETMAVTRMLLQLDENHDHDGENEKHKESYSKWQNLSCGLISQETYVLGRCGKS